MAEKRIERKDIVAPNAITTVTKELLEMEQVLKQIISEFEELIKLNPLKTTANIKKYNDDVQAVNATSKALLTTRKKLAEAATEEGQELAELRLQLQEQNKANKEVAKSKLKLLDAYQKESKRLTDLRKRYKAVAIEQGAASKEARELRKEVVKLDNELKDVDASVGQFTRNVGNYTNQVNKASVGILAMAAAATGLNGDLGDINKTIGATEEGAEETRSVMAQLGAGIGVLQNRLGKGSSSLLNVLKKTFTGEDYRADLGRLSNTFTGFTKEVKEVAEAADIASRAQFALEKSSLALREESARLTSQIDILNAKANDSTKSFNEQEDALFRAQKLSIERSLIDKQIAEEELSIINSRIEARAEDANNLELLTIRTEKLIALQQVQGDIDRQTVENAAAVREVQRDRFERELDFAIDAFDSQKSVNERRVADEQLTFDERVKIFNRTVELTASSFSEQIKLVEGFTNERLNLNELVNIDDERIIRERLRRSEIDDVTLGRILEIIKEQKIARQDLADLERDLNEESKERADDSVEREREKIKTINEIEQEQIQGEIDRLKRTDGNEEEIYQLERRRLEDQADFEISLEETTAEEKELIRAKLNNDLAALDEKESKRKKEDRKKELESTLETAKELTVVISDALAAASDKSIAKIEEQQDANDKAIEEQQRRAEQGLENTLAFEQKKAAELEQEREAEQKKAERRAKVLAYLSLFTEFSKENPNTAAGKALAQVAIAETVSGLFYEGTEKVEDDITGKPLFSGRDGYVIRVDGSERIMTGSQNSRLGGISNEDLVRIAEDSRSPQVIGFDTSGIVAKLDRVEAAIQSNGINVQWDGLENRIETRVVNGIKKKTTHKRGRI